MRILHVVNSLGKGGLENGLVNVINRLDRRAYDHVVCTVRSGGANEARLPPGVEVVALESGTTSRIQTLGLRRLIRRTAPDIVHSRNWGTIEAVAAARWVGSTRVIHSEHGFEAQDGCNEPWRRRLVRRVAFEMADAVVAVSAQLRDIHARRTGFAAARVRVIRNGVDRTRFFPDAAGRTEARRRLGVAAGELCIGCVANLLPVKDHRTLLQALTRSVLSAVPWRLILVGSGPEDAGLRSFAQAHFAAGRVTFLGSSSEVPELLRALDVFVLPSVAEGICNSLLEAMATGTAVIATAVGGNPEVVEDGRSGVLVQPSDDRGLADAIAALAGDDARRRQLGADAVERIRREFSIDTMIQAYDELYQSVVGTGAVSQVAAGYR